MPFFTNHCGHTAREYAGSYTSPLGVHYDCYSFTSPLNTDSGWCVRYSNDPSEYISSLHFITDLRHVHPDHRMCMAILKEFDDGRHG